MKAALVISDRDNVATALERLEPGRELRLDQVELTVIEAIPHGHKVALIDIASGQPVMKYGSAIGLATAAIPAGAHVHTHNLASSRGRGDLDVIIEAAEPRLAEPSDQDPLTPAPDGRRAAADAAPAGSLRPGRAS